ncbi:MAG: MarR family transcriptional regulator [Firmicutes bacterium]|nr:MarR family transcriptional regulator [Bacillota bacterium]
MLEENFLEVYDKFKLEFFRRIFELVREREGSLSAMEAFSIEVIHALHEPTIGQFAEFLNISQSNATYKVNNLIKKGYLKKQNSETDRREYHLLLSEKYFEYTDIMRSYVKTVLGRIEEEFSAEEAAQFSFMLRKISDDMMPEVKMTT